MGDVAEPRREFIQGNVLGAWAVAQKVRILDKSDYLLIESNYAGQ
jgi:hypothetical protein